MTTTMSTTPMATRTMTTSTMTAPARGGITLTIARIELRRVLRNKRTMIFTLVFTVVMFLFIAAQVTGQDDAMGVGVRANVGAYIMASMAIYGAIMATTSAGASSRVSGWGCASATGWWWSRAFREAPVRSHSREHAS
ncbi:MAG: hypothetical protein KDB28_11435, partial [Tetrasphaera sp.]|nr:hypothetical protein [Tetrasphaera sp.]